MISALDRSETIELFEKQGHTPLLKLRHTICCISVRSYQHWARLDVVQTDGLANASRNAPAYKLCK
jgi:hypothetical protein